MEPALDPIRDPTCKLTEACQRELHTQPFYSPGHPVVASCLPGIRPEINRQTLNRFYFVLKTDI